MQLFFNKPSTVAYGIPRYAQWDYVRAGLLRNLETTQKYYHSRILAVKSNHFLCRLINNLNVSHKLTIERYYDLVDARAIKLSAAMRITTAAQRGSIFNGIFYGPDCPEIIMLDSTSIDVQEAYMNWRTLQPVKVINHPRTDYSLMLPNGKPTGVDVGVVTVSVNIGMLAVQYRAFAEDQLLQDAMYGTGLQTVAHFVHRYVLTNMLATHLDIVVFNRIAALINGAPISGSTYRHPFSMPDYSSFSNQVQQKIVNDMKGKALDYKAVMCTIPAITAPTMDFALAVPDNPPTRQVAWADVVTRIDALKTIIKAAGHISLLKNTNTLNYFANEFKYYQGDRSLGSFLPRDIYYDTLYSMNEISELTGKSIQLT